MTKYAPFALLAALLIAGAQCSPVKNEAEVPEPLEQFAIDPITGEKLPQVFENYPFKDEDYLATVKGGIFLPPLGRKHIPHRDRDVNGQVHRERHEHDIQREHHEHEIQRHDHQGHEHDFDHRGHDHRGHDHRGHEHDFDHRGHDHRGHDHRGHEHDFHDRDVRGHDHRSREHDFHGHDDGHRHGPDCRHNRPIQPSLP